MDVESCVSPLESALPAQPPGHADGTDRRAVSGSGPTVTDAVPRVGMNPTAGIYLLGLPPSVPHSSVIRRRLPTVKVGCGKPVRFQAESSWGWESSRHKKGQLGSAHHVVSLGLTWMQCSMTRTS